MPRRYDPGRRERIVDAAVRVVAARGVAALSHRAVAAEADVPLGSTTYHFADREELLVAALRQVNDAWLERFCAGLTPSTRPARWQPSWRASSATAWGSAGSAPSWCTCCAWPGCAIRPCARWPPSAWRRWPGSWAAASAWTPRPRAVVALADGLLIQLGLTGREYDARQVVPVIGRLLAGSGPGAGGTGSRPAAPTG